MRIVTFQKGNGKYCKGDTAGLKDEDAAIAVARGFAFYNNGTREENLTTALRKLPEQEKIQNLCAICGAEFENEEAVREHKEKEHGIT